MLQGGDKKKVSSPKEEELRGKGGDRCHHSRPASHPKSSSVRGQESKGARGRLSGAHRASLDGIRPSKPLLDVHLNFFWILFCFEEVG